MQESTIEEDDQIREKYLNHWHETWQGFTSALVSTEDFHAFQWTIRLLKAGICFVYFKSGFHKLKLHIYWRSSVPALAIALIVLVVSSYFGSLREIIRNRWCCSILKDTKTDDYSCSFAEKGDGCRWILFHDMIVLYLGFMILFNFLSACFRSPGVVLPKPQQAKEEKENNVGDDQKSKTYKEKVPERLRWSSKDSRGGFCGIDPLLDIAREAYLVQNYYNLATSCREATVRRTSFESFPSTQETFCKKCMIKRPPRSHHCSVSNRCVLQYDHHCVWLNNTVGYNNYRAFLLTLFYLNLGCWYGIAVLYRPFLDELNKSSNGWIVWHDNQFSFLELPSASNIFFDIINGTVENEIIIKLVVPFLFTIGVLQFVFFGYHVSYVLSALTTLEYKILLDKQFDQLVKNPSSKKVTPTNPFSGGWLQNLKDAVGPLLLVFLPVRVDPKQINPPCDSRAHKGK